MSSIFALDAGLHHGRRHAADRLPAARDVDEKLGRLPLRYFDGHPRGDLLSRVTNDIDNIGQSLQQSLTQLITSLLTIVGVLILMLTISPLLAVISLLAVPASLVVTILIVRRSQKQFVAQWASTGALNGHVEEMHTGHAIVKAFGRQREAIATFDDGERAALPGELSGPVHLRDHPAGDELHLEPELRRDRGHRRPARRGRPDVASATSSRSSSTRASSRSRSSRPRASSTSSSRRSRRRSGSSSCSTSRRRSPDPAHRAALDEPRGAVAFEDVSFRYEPDQPLIEDLDLVVEAGADRRDRRVRRAPARRRSSTC